MSHLGSVPAGSIIINATATTVPKSSGSPLEVTANLGSDVASLEITSNVAALVNLYTGPNSALKLLCVIPGFASTVVQLPRQPVVLSKGTRLSVRAAADTDLSAGTIIINTWV